MKAIRILAMAVVCMMWLLMAVFTLAALQTIEWCVDSGTEIPGQVWAMLATATAWCILMVNIPSRAQRDFIRFTNRMTDEG